MAAISTFAKPLSGALLLCLVLAQPSSHARTSQGALPDYISEQHRAVLERWLKQRPELRFATAEDLDPSLVNVMKDMAPERVASPFYAVGDFNSDGQQDFAVGLVNRNNPDDLALAVFNGPSGKANRPAYYDKKEFGRGAPLFISTDDRGRDILQLGFGSDTRTVLLKPRGKGYYIWIGATQ